MELNIATLMFIAERSMEVRVIAAVKAAGYDLTPAQGRLAQRVADTGSRLTDLAEQAQITKQTASVLVGALERAGLVQRIPDPSDGRAQLITLSPGGRAASQRANAAAAAVEAEWNDYLGPDLAAALRVALEKLRTITDPYLG